MSLHTLAECILIAILFFGMWHVFAWARGVLLEMRRLDNED